MGEWLFYKIVSVNAVGGFAGVADILNRNRLFSFKNAWQGTFHAHGT